MIGIFDSGSGGLTVLRALRERAPYCDVVYFADFANMPYGNRTQYELRKLTRDAIAILIKQGAREIISACNSVSAQMLLGLSKEFHASGIEIIEMVTPTVNAISEENRLVALPTRAKKILLVATQATISSNIYKNAFAEKEIVIEQTAIPPLAEAIEKGVPEEEIQNILQSYLSDAVLYDIDMVILGCTQYPLIKKSFENFFRKNILNTTTFNPANSVALEAVKQFNIEGNGKLTFLTSKKSERFYDLVNDLFPNTPKRSIVVETI